MTHTATQLTMLKVDLGLITITEDQKAYLELLLDTAASRLEHDGIQLVSGDPEHDNLVVMYAAWLYRKRAEDPDQQQMPRMLALLRNSVLFGQAARTDA